MGLSTGPGPAAALGEKFQIDPGARATTASKRLRWTWRATPIPERTARVSALY